MEYVILISTLIFFAIVGYGIFLAIFKKGRRKKGLYVILGAVVSFALISGILTQNYSEDLAAEKGFESAAEMSEAKSEGISDSEEWALKRDKIRYERERAREADKAEQERLEAKAKAEEERLEAEARAEQKRLEAEAKAKAEAEKQEKRLKGFHCLSAWDGSHTDFKRRVKNAMRNPSSFEHMETRIAPVSEDGQHILIMTYRAENGFGGMNVGRATGLVDNATCAATVISVE